MENLEKEWRQEYCLLASRVDQLKTMRAMGKSVPFLGYKDYPRHWRPMLVPFADRLKLPLTFEMVDLPFADAVKLVSDLSGISINVDAVADQNLSPISLRVTDMRAELSLEWVCKLADVKFAVSQEKEKITISK